MSKKEKYSVVKTEVIEQSFYIVRNKEGKYLRSKGYMGSGNSWVDEIGRAKIYSKPGHAQAQINYWFSRYPGYGEPDLIRVSGVTVEVLEPNKELEEQKIAKEKDKHEKIAKQKAAEIEAEKNRRYQEFLKLKK